MSRLDDYRNFQFQQTTTGESPKFQSSNFPMTNCRPRTRFWTNTLIKPIPIEIYLSANNRNRQIMQAKKLTNGDQSRPFWTQSKRSVFCQKFDIILPDIMLFSEDSLSSSNPIACNDVYKYRLRSLRLGWPPSAELIEALCRLINYVILC